jgi:hypothetical protein
MDRTNAHQMINSTHGTNTKFQTVGSNSGGGRSGLRHGASAQGIEVMLKGDLETGKMILRDFLKIIVTD